MGDHPRACGVYPFPRREGWELRRIIPARAGFTLIYHPRKSGSKDHPRACGVYFICFEFPDSTEGSSPRVRGLHPSRRRSSQAGRIIPARAGFTAIAVRDHPGGPGSSPRVRGLLSARKTTKPSRRIIPARAGFTERYVANTTGITDHPRACGVYRSASIFGLTSLGSSPRVRGLLVCHGVARNDFRIIPARAGFTRAPRRRPPAPGDHPRACGVYRRRPPIAGMTCGSSPRVRGLRDRPLRGGHPLRIIPARAGFTLRWRDSGVCRLGSSPRVRGLREVYRLPPGRRGIIPARAGFTPTAR